MAQTRPAVGMTISPDGHIAISLGGKTVADGIWELLVVGGLPPDADEFRPGPILSSVGAADSPNHAVITSTYAAAKTTCDLTLDGDDLRLALHLQNLDHTKSLKKITLSGLTFHFSRPADGTIVSFFWSYFDAKGTQIFHPSSEQPCGGVYAHDDQFGFGVYSASEFDRQSMFNAEFHKDNMIPPDCGVQLLTTHGVPPDQAVDVDVVFRISANISTAHLLGGYKKIYDQHFPTLLYHPDNRPAAACTGINEHLINRTNPFGFDNPIRRFDSPVGVAAYVRLITPALQQANALGDIFWSPGGYRPPMYPPDFDALPPAVQQNIPALVAGFKKHGLRVGLCARPGDAVTREPGKDPVIYRLDATNKQQMKTLIDRFHHAMDMGFDIFYLDSFGNNNPNDDEILKQIRSAVGPDVLFYTEYCTDMSLPYAGRYCEWEGTHVQWNSPQSLEALKVICPNSTWLCRSRTRRLIPTEFAKIGLVPLVDDVQSNHLPASTQPAQNK